MVDVHDSPQNSSSLEGLCFVESTLLDGLDGKRKGSAIA